MGGVSTSNGNTRLGAQNEAIRGEVGGPARARGREQFGKFRI